MSELANKSEQNLQSAELLIKNNLHAPSVHCSYYSCLQKMSSILIQKYGYSADKLIAESSRKGTGSHDYIINLTFQNLTAINTNDSENQQFKRMIEDFKRRRVDADYRDKPIDKAKSGASLEIAKKINGNLAKVFFEGK